MSGLDAAIRAKLVGFSNDACLGGCGCGESRCGVYGFDEMRAALVAVLDRHKPGYPDGPEYEEHDEPVFDRAGTPQGHVRVKGDPIPGYYCETCREFSPCETVKDIARALGIEVDDGRAPV